MARSIAEIEEQIIQQKNSYAELDDLNSDSATAVWRLWVYITAVAQYTLEKLFDQHKADVDATIAELKPHRPRWYYNKALAFQYGHELAEGGEADYYDNSNRTTAEVEAAKIVTACAIQEVNQSLQIKVSGADGQLTSAQVDAFTTYMELVKDAGVYIIVVNRIADKVKLGLHIIYDPLVLDENGNKLTGGSDEPVRDAVDAYLASLGFNAWLVLADQVDALQQVPGVVIPTVTNAQFQNIDGDYVPIGVRVQPFSGRFTYMDDDVNNLTITYEADNV